MRLNRRLALQEKTAGKLVWGDVSNLPNSPWCLSLPSPLRKPGCVFFAAMNALADMLAAHCPPENRSAFSWPDMIMLDIGILGGGRSDLE